MIGEIFERKKRRVYVRKVNVFDVSFQIFQTADVLG